MTKWGIGDRYSKHLERDGEVTLPGTVSGGLRYGEEYRKRQKCQKYGADFTQTLQTRAEEKRVRVGQM